MKPFCGLRLRQNMHITYYVPLGRRVHAPKPRKGLARQTHGPAHQPFSPNHHLMWNVMGTSSVVSSAIVFAFCPMFVQTSSHLRPRGAHTSDNILQYEGAVWNEVGTKLVRSWYAVGTKLGRSWDEVGTKLGRSWDEVGTKLGRSWYEMLGRNDGRGPHNIPYKLCSSLLRAWICTGPC